MTQKTMLSWPHAPEDIRLESQQVHVWCAALSDFESQLPRLEAMLSAAERARAARFCFSKDRCGYVIRHGILRVILSRYLKQYPSEIQFCYGRFGKPEIKEDPFCGRINFNVSHSGGLALYAVTQACPIGIDVEYLRAVPHLEEIASRFFSLHEFQMLMAVPAECRMESFFACWTRKEAFLKASGEGIGGGLSKVEVTLFPWAEPEILRVAGDSQARTKWQLRSFSPTAGYLAAVAFKHHDLVLSQWRVRALPD